jgi:hypothetical protein
MPTTIPTITKNPHVRFPSTWRDAIGKPLTDSQIRQYAREGFYGPDEKQKQLARDHAKIVEGVLMLARPCETCKDNKTLGSFMRFSYLPKAGYYCDTCRADFKTTHEKAIQERRKWYSINAFD